MYELNPTLRAWLYGPRMPLGKTLILRPGRYPADYESAVQQAFGSLSFDGTWDTREIVEQRHALWDGEAERSIFLAPFSRIWLPGYASEWRDSGLDFEKNQRPSVDVTRNELMRIRSRLWMMAGIIGHDAEVVSIDLETFDRGSSLGAALCDEYYPLVREVVRDIFPKAAIEWYDHGGIRPVNYDQGYATYLRFPEGPEVTERSIVAYTLDSYEITRSQVSMTESAMMMQGGDFTLWLGLRCGYPFDPFNGCVKGWNSDWAYDPGHLARLAAEIKEPKLCRMCDFSKVRRLWGWISFGKAKGAEDRRDLDIDANGRIDHFEAVIPYLDAIWKGAQGEYAFPEYTPAEAAT